MDIISSIKMKVVCGELKPLLGDKESVDIAQIYGYAVKEVKGDRPTMYGDNIWIEGDFKAKNLKDGKQYYARKLYAPEILSNILCSQFPAEGEAKVEFAVVIGLKKSNKGGQGYEFTVRSLIEPREEYNPFAAIENRINPNTASLTSQSSGDPSAVPMPENWEE